MKESSKFYSSLGLLIILNVIIKPLWIFGIDRQVQNAVGTEVYGAYFSLFNFSIVFSFLLDWGLTNFFNRQLAVNQENFISKIGNFFFIKLLFAILYAAVVFGVACLSGVRQWDILLSVIAIQILTSLFLFFRSIFTARQWFRTDAWLSVLDKGLMILLCGSFLYYPSVAGEMTISKFLLIQIICTAFAVTGALILLLKRGINFSIRANSLLNGQLFKSALPFGIIVLLMSVHYRLDGFLLERIHPNGAYEAGLYAGAYRLLDAANMIGYLLASFLLPFIARQWSEKKKTNEVILNSRHLLLFFSLFVITTVVFLAPWIQQVLYHTANMKAIVVLQWCLPALAGYSLVQVYGTVMTATGQVVQFCYIILLSVILNIVLNLLLIPEWGAKGCCLAALISQGFCGIVTMLHVQKKSGINIHFRSLLMYIFIAAILCGFYYWCSGIVISKWILIIGGGLITIAGAIFLKLVDLRKWRDIIKQNNL
jgi:O-antigen/teichoic acid export membrane protein